MATEKSTALVIDFTIDTEDLQLLWLKTSSAYPIWQRTFDIWLDQVKESYAQYARRNMSNIARWGSPKTFSQWINDQIIRLN